MEPQQNASARRSANACRSPAGLADAPGAIALVALNAGYAHSSFALRCVKAALGEAAERAMIMEFDSQFSPLQIAEKILAARPAAAGFSVYIWNVEAVAAVMRVIRAARPEIRLIIGGPQIVEGEDREGIQALADEVFYGEIERCPAAAARPVSAGAPYKLYTDEDIAHRVIYAETSRGCPFQCEYCSSAADPGGTRFFPLDEILPEFDALIARGARSFKFLDRSFNIGGENSLAALDFFLAKWRDGMRLHFEFTPDALDEKWREKLLRFPPGGLHIEVGIQTFNAEVARRIKRPLNPARAEETLRFLAREAKATVHADLIAGLPGETLESFASGFDRLLALGPDELQAGILKNLPGSAISRHDAEFAVRWSPLPPYQILENRDIPFAEMRAMERFSKCWDSLYNSGRFRGASRLLWRDGASAFARVWELAENLYAANGKLHGISPKRLAASLSDMLVRRCGVSEAEAKSALERDARESAWRNS